MKSIQNEIPLLPVDDLSTAAIEKQGLLSSTNGTEVIIGFVGAVGVDLPRAEQMAAERLRTLGYKTEEIHVTRDVLPRLYSKARTVAGLPSFERIKELMRLGSEARRELGNAILAIGVAAEIARRRPNAGEFSPRTAYLVHSLKHPEEVRALRDLYPRGFYLMGVQSAPDRRLQHLTERLGMTKDDAKALMERDKQESHPSGQKIIDTFHTADFFIRWAGNEDQMRNSIVRMLDVMFSDPFQTPAFSEYAMYLAFAASLRSADLGRQVGAVIARDGEILATGANDCPTAGGGLYWPALNPISKKFEDSERGRDWKRGCDSNRDAINSLIDSVLAEFKEEDVEESTIHKLRGILTSSRFVDLTEFGRVVHAEMEALLSCARRGVSTRGATMYCTTFPCHNCAKHIVASGVERVVFVEPYLKSRAMQFHDDSVEMSYPEDLTTVASGPKVRFEPFVGVGPRRFFDLFSMDLGVGTPLIRKDKASGKTRKWTNPTLRVKMEPMSYLEREKDAVRAFAKVIKRNRSKKQ